MKEAKVIYNAEKDFYEIYIRSSKTEEWGYSKGYPCVRRFGDETGEKNFIHFSIISTFAELQHLGYKVDFTKL